jgi:hypothetical protein
MTFDISPLRYSFIIQPGSFDTDYFTSDEAVEVITVGLLPPATAGLKFGAPHRGLIRVIIVPGPYGLSLTVLNRFPWSFGGKFNVDI